MRNRQNSFFMCRSDSLIDTNLLNKQSTYVNLQESITKQNTEEETKEALKFDQENLDQIEFA